MTTTAMVPLRDGYTGKTRLAAHLDRGDRTRLVAALARHVVTTLVGCAGVDRVLVVTREPDFARAAVGRLPVEVLEQPGQRPGLNAAVDLGRDAVLRDDPQGGLLVVHADLPALTSDDIAAVLACDAPVVLAPDRAGTGTNLLRLDPAHPGLVLRFGTGSFAAHVAEAARHGLRHAVVRRPGTATDLDTLADWAALPGAVRDALVTAVPGTAALPFTPPSAPGGPSGPPAGAAEPSATR